MKEEETPDYVGAFDLEVKRLTNLWFPVISQMMWWVMRMLGILALPVPTDASVRNSNQLRLAT
jgi:hypothetical protein